MKKVAILQSNYIPWKGYFDIISAVDEFIIYDDVQFTKSDWRHRNRIKTQKGVEWLSVPVGQNIRRLVQDVEIKDTSWQSKHWASIEHAYKRAPYFDKFAPMLQPLYFEYKYLNLSELNRTMIIFLCMQLGIKTRIRNSLEYDFMPGKTERLISICKQAGADEYISGPSAKNYLDMTLMAEAGIKVTWFNYEGYPEYPQLWGKFEHAVSVIDLLFNVGSSTTKYMKYLR